MSQEQATSVKTDILKSIDTGSESRYEERLKGTDHSVTQ